MQHPPVKTKPVKQPTYLTVYHHLPNDLVLYQIIPDITDTSAKMDHEENVKETNLDADLKTSEEKKTKKIMNDIINKQMKLIKKLKLPVDECMYI